MLHKIIQNDYGKFFIVPIQDLIKVSKLPVPPTRATTHTLIFLTSGVATMNVGFQTVKMKANEFLSVAAGQVFSYKKADINTGFVCNFDRAFIYHKYTHNRLPREPEFLSLLGNPVIKLEKKHATYIHQTFQRMLDEYLEDGLKHINVIRSYLLAVLGDVETSYQPLSKTNNKNAIQTTNKFKALLQQHIKFKHLVTEYAHMLNVSPNHLNKLVKSASGKSPSRWIDETLMLEAKVLLAQTDMSIKEIAAELGIDDQSYFSRLFKRYEGITPRGFREMIETS